MTLICPTNAWTTVPIMRPPAFLAVLTIQSAFSTVSRTRSLAITFARVSKVASMVVKESGRKSYETSNFEYESIREKY